MSDKLIEYRIRQCLMWISDYKGEEPLSSYLKKQFQLNKKMGSRDRRTLSDLMYQYFRLGDVLKDEPVDKRIVIAQYLFNPEEESLHEFITTQTGITEFPDSFSKRFEELQKHFPKAQLEDLFPFKKDLTKGLVTKDFLLGIAKKPLVWLRVRSKYIEVVKNELNAKEYKFETYEEYPNSLSLENARGLEDLQSWQKGYFEVQDLSSQTCASLINVDRQMKIWDACAGAGGKSLALIEINPDATIVFTDIRESILGNLKKRMSKMGISDANTVVMDLTQMDENTNWPKDWDVIIADVPCSGSGTWGRTPEYITYCDDKLIDKYVKLQKDIIQNLSKCLKKGGSLYYITCSVFSKENEGVLEYAVKDLDLAIQDQKIIEGSKNRADTMFFSRLMKK